MDAKLLARRETLLRHMVKGITLQAAAEDMTSDISDPEERERAVNVIRKDWNNRDRWMDNVVRLNEGTFLTELTAAIQEATKHCWIEFARTKNSNVKIGAMRTVIMGETRLGMLLMKAGVISQATQHIESTMTIAGTPFDVDPQFRDAIAKEAERQRLEKEKNDAARRTTDPGQK